MPTIEGLNDPLQDATRLQQFIDVDHPDAEEFVLTGTFNFGGDWLSDPDEPAGGRMTERQTVEIHRGMTIRGSSNVKPATIIGGGAERPFNGFGISSMMVESGPFKVVNWGATKGGNDKPVVIKYLRFSGWKGEAIFAEACQGLKVIGCNFTKPVGSKREFNNATFVNAIFPAGANCSGEFEANDNVCDLRDYGSHVVPYQDKNGKWRQKHVTYPLADDEQFACCFGTKFRTISITHNRIMGYDEGFEVMFNTVSDATIDLSYNFITLTQHARCDPWPGSTGIVCCNNDGSATDIIGNLIVTRGSSGVAFVLSGVHDSANDSRRFVVENNVTHQEGNPDHRHTAAIMLGTNYPMPFPAVLGVPQAMSLNGGKISKNHFSGMAQFGIVTFDILDIRDRLGITVELPTGIPWPQAHVTSQKNQIADNNFLFLDCMAPQVLFTTAAQNNTVTGCFHPAPVDMNGTNVIHTVCPPIANETLHLKLAEAVALRRHVAA